MAANLTTSIEGCHATFIKRHAFWVFQETSHSNKGKSNLDIILIGLQ
jgi:hypothetical protein